MSKQSRTSLANRHKNGDIPNADDFKNVRDSFAHLDEDVVNQTEAEAGVGTTFKLWSPLRIAQAFVSFWANVKAAAITFPETITFEKAPVFETAQPSSILGVDENNAAYYYEFGQDSDKVAAGNVVMEFDTMDEFDPQPDEVTNNKLIRINEEGKGGLFRWNPLVYSGADGAIVIQKNNGQLVRDISQGSKIKPEFALTVGDGTTDDSAKLTATITAATTFNRPIYLDSLDKVYNGNGATLDFAGNKLIGKGGVLKNCTIQNAVIEVDDLTQIFDTDVTIEKSCRVKHLTPQNFGAVTNVDDETYSNACHEAIQALFECPFQPSFPVGYYYITEEVIISKPKTVSFANKHRERHAGSVSTNFPADATDQDQSVIYTDQDIYLLQIASRQIVIDGGTLDCRGIVAHTKAAIRFNLSFYMWGGEINSTIYGNPTSVNTENGGTIGIYAAFDDDIVVDTGFITGWKFQCSMRDVKYGVYLKDNGEGVSNPLGTFANTLYFNCDIDRCKKAYFIDGGFADNSVFEGVFQSRETLIGETEKDYAFVDIRRSRMVTFGNLQFWDIGSQNGSSPYRNSRSYDLYKVQNRVYTYGRSLITNDDLNDEDVYLAQKNGFINDPKGIIFNKKGDPDNISDSLLRNELLLLDNDDVSFAAYEGDAYDFDANLDESTGETIASAISFVNEDLLIRPAYNQTVAPNAAIAGGGTLATDFIEIVFDVALTNGLLYLNFESGSLYPLQIQCIFQYSDATPDFSIRRDVGDRLTNSMRFDNPDGSCNKIILRFIGANETGTLNFRDICYVSNRNAINYLHIATLGLQRLRSALKVDYLQIESSDSNRPFRLFNDTPISGQVKVNDIIKNKSSTGLIYVCDTAYTATGNQSSDLATNWYRAWLPPALLSISGTPIGNITPFKVGQIYIDTDNNKTYLANGETDADWIYLNPLQFVGHFERTSAQILTDATTEDLVNFALEGDLSEGSGITYSSGEFEATIAGKYDISWNDYYLRYAYTEDFLLQNTMRIKRSGGSYVDLFQQSDNWTDGSGKKPITATIAIYLNVGDKVKFQVRSDTAGLEEVRLQFGVGKVIFSRG